jgi:beta-fructofuranosidase
MRCDEAGWAGVQALPRELWLDEGLQLCSCPILEVESLRQSPVKLPEYALTADEITVKQVGSRIEIEAVFSADVEGVLALSVLMSPEGEEVTRLGCDLASREIFLDTTRSSMSESVEGDLQTRELVFTPKEAIRLHALIDSSVIEVWFNDMSLSGRAYPVRPESTAVRVYSSSGLKSLVDLKIWKMSAIWPVDA